MNSLKASGMILLVSSLVRSQQFYETLGLNKKSSVQDVAVVMQLQEFWIELLRSDKVITKAFMPDIDKRQKGAGAYLHLKCDDVDKEYERIKNLGLVPEDAPQDYPWGHREFVVIDPDGYKIVIYSKINT